MNATHACNKTEAPCDWEALYSATSKKLVEVSAALEEERVININLSRSESSWHNLCQQLIAALLRADRDIAAGAPGLARDTIRIAVTLATV